MAWGDLQWGSCQYDTIADMYNRLTADEKSVDITVSFGKIGDFDELKAGWLAKVKQEAEDDSDDIYWENYWTKQIDAIDKAKNLDELFCAWRDTSHDLWYALETAKGFFEDLKMDGELLEETSNFPLGVVAYLLVKCDLITDIDSFKHFDT
jgi:hypothetical protein